MKIKKFFKAWWMQILFLLLAIIFFIKARMASGWDGLAWAILFILFLIMLVLSLIFKWLKHKFKIKMNWWKYVLVVIGLFFASYGILLIIARV